MRVSVPRAALFALAALCFSACGETERSAPEVIEIRSWDEGCRAAPLAQAGPAPSDTIAYQLGRRSDFRIVSLGGCVDSYFYEQERRFFTVLDTLSSTASPIVWPFDQRLWLSVSRAHADEIPSPADSAFTLALSAPGTTGVAFFGFSKELGLLWATVHQGPSFRLASIERQPGATTALIWSKPHWPLGSPAGDPNGEGVAVFDSLWKAVQRFPPVPSFYQGL